MRDYDYDDGYDSDYSVSSAPSVRRGLDGLEALAFVGALALIAAPALSSWSRRWRETREVAKADPEVDKTLKDSFPASDPPASRYFDIPENRR